MTNGGRECRGGSLAGKVLTALMVAAATVDTEAIRSWNRVVRHKRPDLAEVCCTADSQLSSRKSKAKAK